MVCVLAVYPNHPGSRFDLGYYSQHHAPYARGLLQPYGLTDLRVVAGESALDDAAPPFWAVSEMYFDSRAAFEAGMAACGAALFADAANYTDVAPILQFAAVVDLPTHAQEP